MKDELSPQIRDCGGHSIGQISHFAPQGERARLDSDHFDKVVEDATKAACFSLQGRRRRTLPMFGGQRIGGRDNCSDTKSQ